MVRNPPANVGDTDWIPGSGRSPGEGNGNPLQEVFLPGKSHGQRSLVGYCQSIGLQKSPKGLRTKQQQQRSTEMYSLASLLIFSPVL